MDTLYLSSIFLFSKNRIHIPEEQFRLELYSHPDYPTLLALTDTVSILKLKYTVGKCDYNDLLQNKQPALLLLESNFVVIQAVHEKEIYYYDVEEKITKKANRDIFEKEWDGSVLYMSNEASFNLNNFLINWIKKYREWLLIIGIVFLLTYTLNWKNISNLIFLITKIVGITFCLLLTKHHLKSNNTLLTTLCKNGNTFSCDTVLNSKYSRILGVSLSDIGMVYFAATLLALIYYNIVNDANLWLLLLGISVSSFPIICISVFYQGLIIKKWCPLCLSVMAVLLIEGITAIYWLFNTNIVINFSIQPVIMLFSFVLLSGYVWSLWTSNAVNSKLSLEARFELLKIKKNINIFKELLNMSRSVELYQSDDMPTYGKKENTITLMIVMNVYCKPCAEAHSALMDLLSLFPEKLNIQILFTGNLEDESDSRNDISLYLLQVFNQHGIDAFEKELASFLHASHDKKVERSYSFDAYTKEIRESYYHGLEWIKNNQISSTPTIFINKSELPPIYQVSDLKYILNDL